MYNYSDLLDKFNNLEKEVDEAISYRLSNLKEAGIKIKNKVVVDVYDDFVGFTYGSILGITSDGFVDVEIQDAGEIVRYPITNLYSLVNKLDVLEVLEYYTNEK